MNNLKSKKILASLIEFISYHIFPFIFIFVHNLNNYTIHGFLIIMIAMVALYKEYIITLSHIDDNCLFVEPAYSEKHERYLSVYSCDFQIAFISADITMKFYEELIDSGLNTVLYEFE